MTKSQRLQVEQSEKRQKINALLGKDELSAEERAELEALTARMQQIEPELRAALVAEGAELDEQRAREEARGADNGMSAEQRERLELRGRVSVGAYLAAALKGRAVTGAEAELQQAAAVDGIPLEAFDTRAVLEARARREAGAEHRVITPAPGTVGINLDPIRPAVFAPSIADRLMIDMPQVASGTYATGTIGTSTTAGAVAKSADVPQTPAAITVQTATPKRVGASLALTLEDIAAVGQANFESILRDNISLVLSDELDDQMINGAGGTDLTGIFGRLDDPSAPAAQVETWTRFLAIQSGGIDGLWATMLSHIAIVVNPETYRLAAATFQGADSEESAASYLERMGAAFWTNSRMPAKTTHVAQGILCRKGRMGMRTAVCPHWGYIGIDDIYSGARKGERYFTLSVLVGDVILVQPAAYAQVAFRVSV